MSSKLYNANHRVGVIGLGYVGLPLLYTFHQAGLHVTGFDIDESKIESIIRGESYIKHFDNTQILELSGSERCVVTNDFTKLTEVDSILICVPTPLNQHREPDMTYVASTARTIGQNLKKGQLVILESTTYPGTTDELLREIIESESGLVEGADFYLAYSPEREDPGNTDFNTKSIPKVVGSSSKNGRDLAVNLYEKALDKVIPVSSAKIAESAKLLENIFRSVNIALVNEMKLVMDAMNIDIHEVVDAAATKPFGFMKFTPGPGLGGHCIPIDPFYFTWKAKEYGLNTRFIELAGEVNNSMPEFVVNKTILALNNFGKAVKGSNILILGVAYKPNVDDMRESPSFTIMDRFIELGAKVEFYDPWIPIIPSSREHMNWKGKKSISWSEKVIKKFDSIVIVTDHENVDYSTLLKWGNNIIDTRNVFSDLDETEKTKVYKA